MTTNTAPAEPTSFLATWFLIYAVKHNKPELAESAILWGADVNVRLKYGNSLLHICTTTEIAKILLANGGNLETQNDAGQTPLHTAMRRDLPSLALYFIAHNANVNSQEPNGIAPLHLAEASAVNAALLQKHALVDIQDNAGDTPLHLAIRIKGSPMVVALVDAGANKEIRNNLGNNAYNELVLLTQRRENELAKVTEAILDPAQPISNNSEALNTLNTRFQKVQKAYAARGNDDDNYNEEYLTQFMANKIKSGFKSSHNSEKSANPLDRAKRFRF